MLALLSKPKGALQLSTSRRWKSSGILLLTHALGSLGVLPAAAIGQGWAVPPWVQPLVWLLPSTQGYRHCDTSSCLPCCEMGSRSNTAARQRGCRGRGSERSFLSCPWLTPP